MATNKEKADEEVFKAIMGKVAALPYDKLDNFARLIRSHLTANNNPTDENFCKAIFEAAKKISLEVPSSKG